MKVPDDRAAFFSTLYEVAGVYLHLEPGFAGVVLPEHLKKKDYISLELRKNMPIPITNLRVDGVELRATLSFNRSPFNVVVPWDAVFAISDDNGQGVAFDVDRFQKLVVEPIMAKEKAKSKKGGRFVALEGGRKDDNNESEERPAPNHLRLVK